VWRLLPRHVQPVLLQACSCRVLAAGQVLLDTTSAAATGAGGAAAGCIGLAVGAVLTVVPKRESGDAATAVAAQHTVLPRASLTPRAPGAAAAAAEAEAGVIGCNADSYDPTPAMTPRTAAAAAAAAAAGWQTVRAHVTSGSGAGSSAVDMGSHPVLPGIARSEHGEAQRANLCAKAEQHTSGSSSSSSAAGSHKWDELSAAVVGPQRMKTAAFKALGREVSK
jgi:hypothetical protein